MEIVTDLEMIWNLSDSLFQAGISELFGNPSWILPLMSYKKLIKAGKENKQAQLLTEQSSISTKKYEKADRELIAKLSKKENRVSRGEIEGIALAKNRNLLFIAGDIQARTLCISLGARYMTIPMLLKALWAKKIFTKKEVWLALERMQSRGNIKFNRPEMIFDGA